MPDADRFRKRSVLYVLNKDGLLFLERTGYSLVFGSPVVCCVDTKIIEIKVDAKILNRYDTVYNI